MQALLAAIRAKCPPQIWQRAAQLAQNATVTGKRTHNDELEVRVLTRGGASSPLVCLSPNDLDWSCECDSVDEACIHVAASALWMADAEKRGEDVTRLTSPTAKLVYRLKRQDGALRLDRFQRRGEELVPLVVRMTALQRRGADDEIAVAQADLAVDLALGGIVSGKIPRPLMTRVLNALAECTDVELDGQSVTIGPAKPVICALVEDHPEGFRLQAVQDPSIKELFDNGAVLQGKVLRPVGELDVSPRDLEELRKGRLYEFGQVADLVGRVLPALRERLPVEVQSKLLPSAIALPPRLVFKTEYSGDGLTVLPTIVYGDPPCARVDAGKLHYLGGPLPLRNENKERRLQAELESRTGMQVGHSERFYGEQAVQAAQRLRGFDGASVEGPGFDACFVAPPLVPDLKLDGDRFQLSFASRAEGGEVRHASAEAVLRAYQRNEQLVPLMEGGWAALPAGFLERSGHLVADLVAAKGERGELPAAALPDLARLCEALDHPPPPSFTGLRALIDGFEHIPEATLPADLTATLRPYQLEGVSWLTFMSRAGLGAMLADDMGLGKTLQALCAAGAPTLVVAPASVLYNWQREIARFRPALRVNVYHGGSRALDDADITLTSYATLRNDVEVMCQREWDTVVLDEAQNIKNADSQAARAAFELPARFRITLTGTPVENRLDELWSQFHFLNRGLLGGRKDFEERYSKPIGEGDQRAVDRLRARLRPFLLRRLKRDVARDLPPRTEVVLRCILGEPERALYDAIRAATQKEVLQELQAGGSVLKALEALLRLRQACCHPSLVPGGQSTIGSAKLELLLRTLDEIVAEGHKALVFSQWTSLLDLVEPEVTRAGLQYCRLDGSTQDRGAVVDRFQDPNGPPLMLISLKAGGTGLNLTAADHVFLLDPWWNPAVEDQAADRAHRIGQTKPVLVQRLVAVDTVEERMLELQDKKRALAAAATGDARASGGITRQDLLALLQ